MVLLQESSSSQKAEATLMHAGLGNSGHSQRPSGPCGGIHRRGGFHCGFDASRGTELRRCPSNEPFIIIIIIVLSVFNLQKLLRSCPSPASPGRGQPLRAERGDTAAPPPPSCPPAALGRPPLRAPPAPGPAQHGRGGHRGARAARSHRRPPSRRPGRHRRAAPRREGDPRPGPAPTGRGQPRPPPACPA